MKTPQTGQGWRCAEDGCPTAGSWQYPIPPMTPREAFERHSRLCRPPTKETASE